MIGIQLLVREWGDVHLFSNLLSRRQAHLLASEEVPYGEPAHRVAVGERSGGQPEKRVRQVRVELTHWPGGRRLPGCVEELAPLHF